jgi:hypothetical protein
MVTKQPEFSYKFVKNDRSYKETYKKNCNVHMFTHHAAVLLPSLTTLHIILPHTTAITV